MSKSTYFLSFIILFSLVISLSSSTYHPIKISYFELKFSQDNTYIRATFNIFKDDFIQAISQGKIKTENALGKKYNYVLTKKAVRTYLMNHVDLKIDNQSPKFTFKSMKLSEEHNRVTINYSIPFLEISQVKKIFVKNTVLLEQFPNQSNIIKIRLSNRVRKIIQLDTEETSATRNF